jgi:hypothetical protein
MLRRELTLCISMLLNVYNHNPNPDSGFSRLSMFSSNFNLFLKTVYQRFLHLIPPEARHESLVNRASRIPDHLGEPRRTELDLTPPAPRLPDFVH